MPIKSLSMRNRKIAFGHVGEMLGRLEGVAASVEVERAGGTDGEQCGDVDGTNSGDNVDSKRVEAVRLATDSQQLHNNAKTQ